MTEQIPPELQHQLIKLQKLQDQYTRLVQERSIVEAELKEAERVLEALEKLGENDPVYRSVGTVLVKASKEELVKEYSDKKEILEIRLGKLKEQEKLLQEQVKKVQDKIKELTAKSYALGAGRAAG